MVSALRPISKCVKRALHFRKVLENEGFKVFEKWALGQNVFWIFGIFWVRMG